MPGGMLRSVLPILFVRDVASAARYWRETLGFEVDFLHGEPPFYGSVSRDGVCLHLRHVDRPNFAELAAWEPSLILASFDVDDVVALFEEFRRAGAAFAQEPTRQPWDGTDVHVRDPDGNVVSFVAYARPVAPAQPPGMRGSSSSIEC